MVEKRQGRGWGKKEEKKKERGKGKVTDITQYGAISAKQRNVSKAVWACERHAAVFVLLSSSVVPLVSSSHQAIV